MSEFIPDRVESRPSVPLILEPSPPLEPPLHTGSYTKGFQDGLTASGASTASLVLSGCGVLALMLACVMLMRHASRLMGMYTRASESQGKSSGGKHLLSALFPLRQHDGLCRQKGGKSAPCATPAAGHGGGSDRKAWACF